MEWVENTLIDSTNKTEKERKIDNSQAITVTEQTKASKKRTRNEEGYLAETITENKFKIIYNKREKIVLLRKKRLLK